MVGYKENYIDIFDQAQDYDKLGAVKYTDMNLNILPVLMDSLTLRPIDFDEETRSYISINYNIESYDISGNNYESYQHPQEEIIEARKCVMSDFDRSTYVTDKYKEFFINYKLNPICPEFPEKIEF